MTRTLVGPALDIVVKWAVVVEAGVIHLPTSVAIQAYKRELA